MSFADPPIQPGLIDPPAVWVYDWLIPIAGGLILLAVAAPCFRKLNSLLA